MEGTGKKDGKKEKEGQGREMNGHTNFEDQGVILLKKTG